jgi:hypothetical protein
MITVDELQSCLPANLKSAATQDLADKINQLASDPDVAEQIIRNFVTLSSVLKDGRYKLADYMNAVQYVSYKLMGMTNKDAYIYAFPQRYQNLVARGASEKDISAYVAGYSKGKLVGSLMEQAAIPVWILHQGTYQEAINRQLYLMQHANSEKVQSDAANSLLTHLKRPETKHVAIDIDIKESDGMKEMKALMNQLAEKQVQLIQQGVTTKKIAHQGLGDMIDITPEEEKTP